MVGRMGATIRGATSGQLSNCVTLTATKATRTIPVGNYSPRGDSPYGVADGAGNVWSGTCSLYKAYPYAASDGRENPPARDLLILRGGSWFYYESYVRCAERLSYNPNFSDDDLGFRVVASAEM